MYLDDQRFREESVYGAIMENIKSSTIAAIKVVFDRALAVELCRFHATNAAGKLDTISIVEIVSGEALRNPSESNIIMWAAVL